jgi:hypothetical protein
MADKYTTKDVYNAYDNLVAALPLHCGDRPYIQIQTGLGGGTRVTVGNINGIGSLYWVGCRQATEGMWRMVNAANLARVEAGTAFVASVIGHGAELVESDVLRFPTVETADAFRRTLAAVIGTTVGIIGELADVGIPCTIGRVLRDTVLRPAFDAYRAECQTEGIDPHSYGQWVVQGMPAGPLR